MRITFPSIRQGARARLTVLDVEGTTTSDDIGLVWNAPGKKDVVRRRVKTLVAGRGGVFEWVAERWSVGVLVVEKEGRD